MTTSSPPTQAPLPTLALPDRPNLEQLRRQAKDLQRAVRAHDAAAVAEAADRHPEGVPAGPAVFSRSAAQLVIARRYGFASWARLKRYVTVVQQFSRYPDELADPDATASPAEEFLRLACLSYTDDQPGRWAAAARVLADHPELTRHHVHAAAAAADVDALAEVLAADPAAANREGGPYRWAPLIYLAYARHDPAIERGAVLTAGRLLFEAGADPDAGYLWHGMPSPFTVLTGAFGEGELGPVRQPRHPHSIALARLVLEAGADPNDSQTLYNRQFGTDDDHLDLLFEFGLGGGDGGPWRRRLGNALDSPARLVRRQLRWAITHGMTERVHLLVEHGADAGSRLGGLTAAELAATTGHTDLVDFLVTHGCPDPALPPAQAFVAAALNADRAACDRLEAEHPGLADEVRSANPALVVWAATVGSAAVELLVAAGFDVNAKGRTDVMRPDPWQTALHHAVESNQLELARTLLALGADPDIRDRRFDATPLGWARYFEFPELIDLLEPLTAADVVRAT